jgi:hypothetical protein
MITKRTLLLGLHWTIIVNLAIQMAYAAWMVFVVFAPESPGPLFDAALTMPHEAMVTRRLYASEFWIACVGLSLYLGITEIAPALRDRERTTASAVDIEVE